MDTIKQSLSGPQIAAIAPTGLVNTSLFCPLYNDSEINKLAWLEASVSRGRQFLASQPAFAFIQSASLVLQNIQPQGLKPEDQATYVNLVKRQVKEIISLLGNLNPEWQYKSPELQDKFYDGLVAELNSRLKTWWNGETFPQASIKEALQHAATSCGYLSPVWENDLFGSDFADVKLKVYGPEDVLVDQIPQDWDLQKAYAVHLFESAPTLRLKQLWASQESKIVPNTLTFTDQGQRNTGATPTGVMGMLKGSAIFNLLSGGGTFESKNQSNQGIQTKVGNQTSTMTDIYITYISDVVLNQTGEWLDSKDFTVSDEYHKSTTVQYLVPPLNTPVAVPTTSGIPKEPITYLPERCQLYPTRRVIIWCKNTILYDGPSHYAHGMVPLVKLQLDPQVWNYLGGCIAQENLPADKELNRILKEWFKSFRLRINPPVEFDTGEISPAQMQAMNIYQEGGKFPRKGHSSSSRAITPIHPYQHFEIADQALPLMQYLEGAMNNVLGTNDFSSLMKMQQVPDADSIDKLMAALGPMVSDYASNLEKSLTQLGYMIQWLWIQFDTTSLRIARGAKSSDAEFDADSGNIIPAVLPYADDLTNSSRFYRIRYVARKMRFHITPQSIFNLTDWKRKMLALQLYREPAFPMDSKTIADILGIDNFGDIEGDTIIDRWVNERKMVMPFEARMQGEAMQSQMVAQAVGQVQAQHAAALAAQELQQETGVPSMEAMMMQAGMQQGAGEGSGGMGDFEQLLASLGASAGPGRPASGGQPPQIETKQNPDGSERLTVTES